jgi:hypothetical protein
MSVPQLSHPKMETSSSSDSVGMSQPLSVYICELIIDYQLLLL